MGQKYLFKKNSVRGKFCGVFFAGSKEALTENRYFILMIKKEDR